jgi:hypothetical protein
MTILQAMHQYYCIFNFFYSTVMKDVVLSPYLFAIVMDEVTRDMQGDISWCMLFTDDVVLVDESRTGVDQKLKLW